MSNSRLFPAFFTPLNKLLFGGLFSLLSISPTNAQFVAANGTAAQVANALSGQGVVIFNATFSGGAASQFGTFTNVGSNVPFASGVFMATGVATEFNGIPINAQGGYTTPSGPLTPGDPVLDAMCGCTTNDAAVFEFDFIPESDSIFFNYVFGSEEYNEYACSQYNDVFSFLISGPGFGGPTNIALVPGTNLPVAINSINNGTVGMFGSAAECTLPAGSLAYSAYFIDNTAGPFIEFDGLTEQLVAKAEVVPCSTYHIRLAVADVYDSSFDSGVFLEAGSFSSNILDVQPLSANGDSVVTEGCNTGAITLTLNEPVSSNYNVPFSILGTATNGVDYAQLTAANFVIPAGDSSVTITINPVADAIPEGIETLLIAIQTSACLYDTVVFYINEEIVLAAPNVTCTTTSTSSINFSWGAVAGATGYQVSTDGGVTWVAANPGPLQHNVTGLPPAASVTLQVQALGGTPGCNPNGIGTATCSTCSITPTLQSQTDVSCNGGSNGTATAEITVGAAPYTFSWSNGQTQTSAATTFTATGLPAGVHTCTVTEGGGCAGTVSVTITQPSAVTVTIAPTQVTCNGAGNGSATATGSGGTGGYTFSWSNIQTLRISLARTGSVLQAVIPLAGATSKQV